MGHVDLMFPNDYLKCEDLRGADVTLTIAKLVQEDLRVEKGTETKWIIDVVEMIARNKKDPEKLNKRIVVNKTNAHLIAEAHGPETNNWPGKRITMYPTRCLAFGKDVGCIRVRPEAPKPLRSAKQAEPEPPPPPPEPEPVADGEKVCDDCQTPFEGEGPICAGCALP